jgi:ATP-dependent RNA helicase DDX47/RRP3
MYHTETRALMAVLQYRNPADYVHRVGRTARAGCSGLSVSILTQYDLELWKVSVCSQPCGMKYSAFAVGNRKSHWVDLG